MGKFGKSVTEIRTIGTRQIYQLQVMCLRQKNQDCKAAAVLRPSYGRCVAG